jgi:hypothetical protein
MTILMMIFTLSSFLFHAKTRSRVALKKARDGQRPGRPCADLMLTRFLLQSTAIYFPSNLLLIMRPSIIFSAVLSLIGLVHALPQSSTGAGARLLPRDNGDRKTCVVTSAGVSHYILSVFWATSGL